VYAIGDIHGCLSELDQLLERIGTEVAGRTVNVKLIFLGDYIDRGVDSAGVLSRLSASNLPGNEHMFLMGNHEEILLAILGGNTEHMRSWLRLGGLQTMESYGVSADEVTAAGADLLNLLRNTIPPAHLHFMRGLRTYAMVGDYLFVHAGIRPGVRIEQQIPSDTRWIRKRFLEYEGSHGAIVVHGHTIRKTPDVRVNRIGIDTGCFRGGPLTAAVLEGSTLRFLTS
jgi:serine/threonine protein phosphatase 1